MASSLFTFPSIVGAYCNPPLRMIKRRSVTPSQTIGAIVRGFKSLVTKRINTIRDTPGESVWQRNYYEHVIRNEKELNGNREYIMNNPIQWELDEENP